MSDIHFNHAVVPLKNSINRTLNTGVVVSMDRRRTRLIKHNIYCWNLVVCDEEMIVPISVPVNMDNLSINDENRALNHYIEERNAKYHTKILI
ncbi:hypothetical protein [Staphylococcus canis]|uniref:Uncharacterized protein n=1 Tax=Staphylococcus canis TaxID=2724942 RepID=A0ABS0TAM7_9STAP|nr:hypothetical protein [Staphylococcus canis]MBI5974818.1 hypothetical protein [Staphylococcus canis]